MFFIYKYQLTCSDLTEKDEIFYPGTFTNLKHDGSNPVNGWENIIEDPENEIKRKSGPLFNGIGGRVSLPIDKLIHVTHAELTVSIECQNECDPTNFVFKANPKNGKAKSKSYKCNGEDSFIKIKPSEKLVNGKLSWWSPEIVSCYMSNSDGDRKSVWEAAHYLKSKRIFLAPYLSNPSESPYGNRGFIADFKSLLKCYLESRKDISVDDIDDKVVLLRVGGTLRYRHEICYVVIVCTKYDKDLKDQYPSLYGYKDLFDHKGMVLQDGQIIPTFFTSQETIYFKPQYIIKCVPSQIYSDYETPAFAFYYPEGSDCSAIVCTENLITKVIVSHEIVACIKGICKQKKT